MSSHHFVRAGDGVRLVFAKEKIALFLLGCEVACFAKVVRIKILLTDINH